MSIRSKSLAIILSTISENSSHGQEILTYTIVIHVITRSICVKVKEKEAPFDSLSATKMDNYGQIWT